jgi:hypothetical protein
MSSAKPGLVQLARAYLEALGRANPGAGQPEFEVRFGGARGFRRLGGADCDRAVARLRSLGFALSPDEHLLRISAERPVGRPAGPRAPAPRIELRGLREISAYCETNQVRQGREGPKARFEQKTTLRRGLGPEDNQEFEFRASLQLEKSLPASSRPVKEMLADWENSDKFFRYMNRTTLRSDQFPVRVDVSVVKAAKGRAMTESGLLHTAVTYEIEIEVDSARVGVGTEYDTADKLVAALKRVCTYVLQGTQGTNYPVGRSAQDAVLGGYASLVGAHHAAGRPLRSWAFAGPSSVTLQVNNIATPNPAAAIPNVREHYTVTDKADGERKLLYVDVEGKVFLITTNMQVQFSGATAPRAFAGTLLDGEHIAQGKDGQHINVYAAFDIYWLAGKSARDLPFAAAAGIASRLSALVETVSAMELTGARGVGPPPLRLVAKTFEVADGSKTIFEACAAILRRQADGMFEYETDGLIFTPARLAVGAAEVGAPATPPKKATWGRSFKWKPPSQNTIDFLVVLKKAPGGSQDVVHNIFQGGTDVSAATQLTQYKTAILCVGHDMRKGGANPCQEMLEGGAVAALAKQVTRPGRRGDDTYGPVQFFPTQPYDPQAGECNLLLSPGAGDRKVMLTESKEAIEDQSIVEFRYDPERDGAWRWVPLRVRHDKTADLRGGGRNFGNDERVANSNWRSLHNPVTEAMLATGADIPDELADDDVYYNRVSRSKQTRALRDFHNRYVKHSLIVGVSQPGGTLIDLAAGKGGDLPKWTDARAAFVLGVDVSRDNIHNLKNGACVRYLRFKRSMKAVPRAIFLQGNSSRNVRDGSAFGTEKSKARAAAVFGKGPKSKTRLEPMVYDAYGVAERGFGVCSMQFAIHYMWSTPGELQGFLRNVAETTAEGGHFIGTCFDGEELFRLLAKKKEGESVTYTDQGTKLWEVTKRYDRDTYESDASCLGYAIDVYQESINKTFREYLVNHVYLTRLLEDYGFAPLTPAEAQAVGLAQSSGGFRVLFAQMEQQLAANPRLANRYGAAASMSAREKDISFLNRYFVYKKVRSVDAQQVMYGLLGDSLSAQAREEHKEEEEAAVDAAVGAAVGATVDAAVDAAHETGGPITGSVRKTGRKLRLRTG